MCASGTDGQAKHAGRVGAQLSTRGIHTGKERVRKLMKVHGLRARGKRKFKATTNSSHGLPVSPNLLERRFAVEAPNRVWAGDITYVWTQEGWLYLAVVIDLFSRQVVGFAMSERMTRQLVIDALRMAWFRRPAGDWSFVLAMVIFKRNPISLARKWSRFRLPISQLSRVKVIRQLPEPVWGMTTRKCYFCPAR